MDEKTSEIKKLLAADKLEEAESLLSTTLGLTPHSPELIALQSELTLKLGSLFWDKGDVDKALDYFTTAMESNPFDRSVVIKCGGILTELEQRDAARKVYSSYLGKNPDDEEIMQALRKLQPVSEKAIQPPQLSEAILVAVNLVPFKDQGQLERQQGCINSISGLMPSGVVPVNICYPDESMRPKGWEVSPALSRSADKELKIDGKRKPFVTDLFDAAAAWAKKKDIKWFIITNSDIIFTPELVREIRRLLNAGYETIAVSRHDIVNIDQSSGTATGYIEFRGSDVFVCETSWWKNNRQRFQPYIFGERAWDNAFTSIMASHSRFHILLKEGLCFHIKHPETWISGPYADYNMSIFNGVDKPFQDRIFAFIIDAARTSKHALTDEAIGSMIEKHFHSPVKDAAGQEQVTGAISKGLTSVILLVSGNADYARSCIESVKMHTPAPCECILVPMAPSGKTLQELKSLSNDAGGFRLLENAVASNYPGACNRGIVEASGEYIVLLSDDVLVTEGWLPGMLEHLNRAPDIGIVAPMTVNVDGPQGVKRESRSRGVKESSKNYAAEHSPPGTLESWNPDADELEAFAGAFRERNRYRRIETVNLNGFCLLFRKDLSKKIGLMDEKLEIPDFADNDYCLRAATEGYRNLIAGDVFVHGRRNRTLEGRSKDFLGDLPKISKLFFEKWDAVDPASPLGKKLNTLNALTAARELIQKGRENEAVKILRDRQQIDPDDKRIYLLLAEFLIAGKKFADAFEVLGNMPEHPGEDAERFELMGFCKASLNRFEEAGQYADAALSLDHASSKALNLKGVIARGKGDPATAETFFRKAIEADKGNGEPFTNLAELRLNAGDREEAFTLSERGFVLSPTAENIIVRYSENAILLSRFDRAERVMKEAITLFPAHKGLKSALTAILLKQEKNREAMDLLEDTLLECGLDDDTLGFALKVRGMIGPEINKQESRGQGVEDSSESLIATPSTPGTLESLNPSVSLCMIVKNEENNIGRCLRKIRPAVDEMIVVDTGSSDGTKDIAAAFGAKVFDFPWTDDFSVARNFSLSKASGDWILILDADEVISSKDHGKLRELLEKQRATLNPSVAYSFVTRNYIYAMYSEWSPNQGEYIEEEAGTGWIPSEKVRLFPNDARVRFSNPVHELVEYSLSKAGIEIRKAGIPVHHHGKLQAKRETTKRSTYYDLGKIKLDQRGERDASALYELAAQALSLGKYEEALDYWQKLVNMRPDLIKAYIGLGTTYFNLGRYKDAVLVLRKAMELKPGSRDLITQYAIYESCAGNIGSSVPLLEGLLKREPAYPLALGLLSALYFCSGRKQEGLIHAKKMQETNFEAASFFLNFARSLITAEQRKYAIALLEAAIEGKYATDETYKLLEEAKEKGTRGQGFEDSSESLIAKPWPPGTLESSKPVSVSLCMIVKDEENNIERALSSIKPVVGEMVVVDTGSVDKTREIARSLGAKVFDFPWTDSFADARNFALAKASGRWILVLDADEIISPVDHKKLKKLIKKSSGKSVAYSFTTRNYVTGVNTVDWIRNDGKYREEAGTGWFPGEKVRFFRNKPGIGFDYPVHERIEPSLVKNGMTIEKCNIPIHHYGMLDEEKQKSKKEKYYKLAKRKLTELGSADATALHELAVQAAEIGKHEEALEHLGEAVRLKPDFSRAFLSMGNNYFNIGRYDDALIAYGKALEIDSGLRDAVLQSARCELYTGNPEAEVALLEEFLRKEPNNAKALAELAAGYFIVNRRSDGMRRIEELKELHFDYKGFFSLVARTLISVGKADLAISLLKSGEGTDALSEDADLLLSASHIAKRLNDTRAKVSLILPVSEKSGSIAECIRSIKESTLEPREVILVPREDSIELKGRLARIAEENPNFKLVGMDGKLTYAEANNRAIDVSSGEYIVLLEDDVIVTAGWLAGLLECAMGAEDAGVVGPMMDNVEGPQGIKPEIAALPSVVRNDTNISHRSDKHNDTSIFYPPLSSLRGGAEAISSSLNHFARSFRQKNRYRRIASKKLHGACLIVSRAVYAKIGHFDEKLETPEYTIEDYCLRASLEGHRNLIAGDVFVHRADDISRSDLAAFSERMIEHNKHLFADRKYFIDKWRSIDIDSAQGQNLFAVNALNFAGELSRKGQKQNAVSALLEGLKYAPDNGSLHFSLVELLLEERNFNEAIEILEKMPEALKKDVKSVELLGYCKQGLHLNEEADRYADEAISSNGSSAKAWNLKGLLAYERSDLDSADKFFQKALELDKSMGETYANIGAVAWNRGLKDKALDLFERAVALSPVTESIVINYHSAAVSLSQLERAEITLRDAATVYPSDKRLKYVLVDILLQKGKYNDAMAVLEEAMLAFGIDDETLALSIGIREKIGPQEIRGEIATRSAVPGTGGTSKVANASSVIARSEATKQSPVSVSLCMIVKNEEKNIAKCLHSAAALADEMIVVDTGSTDKTKDIAKAFGAKVFDLAWKNDFSEARNFSLSKAAGDFILVLDADEIIAPLDQEVLRRMLDLPQNRYSAFTIITRNYVVLISSIGWKANDGTYIKEEAGTGWYPSSKARIFPNNPHIRFQYPVHEFVELSLEKAGIKNFSIDIPVHHYGKLHGEKIVSKGEEYYILGKMKLSQRGEKDYLALYELAVQASELQKFDEALDYWQKLIEVRPDSSEAFFGIANSYYRLGKFEEAFDSLEEVLRLEKNDPKQREVAVLHASCSLRLGKAETSIPLLEQMLKRDPEFPMGMIMLALVYCATNNREAGKRYMEKLAGMRLYFIDHLIELIEFLLASERYSYALPAIETAMEIDKTDARFPALLAKCKDLMKSV